MAIHMATGKASRVYSISLLTFHMKVSIHTASLETVDSHHVRPVTGLMAPRKQHVVVYWPVLTFCEFYLACTISVYNVRNKGFPSNIISVRHF